MRDIADGVWPTMITPFTEEGTVDYPALSTLVQWYLDRGVAGLFAVCQSSEMFLLSLAEREELARFVVDEVAGRVPVVASGHVADTAEDQSEEIERLSATGIDAFVLVTNRLAAPDEPDTAWIARAESLLDRFPDVRFGMYECPYPDKRLLSLDVLRWCVATGRFWFLKDTSCSVDVLRERLDLVRGGELKIFNANTATLLDSLRLGAAGFSGVMTNIHPDLYVWLTQHWADEPERAAQVQAYLGSAALIERQCYPVNAKYSLQLEGLPLTLTSRVRDAATFGATERLEVEQLRELDRLVRTWLLPDHAQRS